MPRLCVAVPWLLLLAVPASSLHVSDVHDELHEQEKAMVASLMKAVAGEDAHEPGHQVSPASLLSLSSPPSRALPAAARTDMLAAMRTALEDMAAGDEHEKETYVDRRSNDVEREKSGGVEREMTRSEDSTRSEREMTADTGSGQDQDEALRLTGDIENVLRQASHESHNRAVEQGLGDSTAQSALQMTKKLETLLSKKAGGPEHERERAPARSSTNQDEGSKSLKSQMSDKIAHMAQEVKDSGRTESRAEHHSASDDTRAPIESDSAHADQYAAHKDERDSDDSMALVTKLLSALDDGEKKGERHERGGSVSPSSKVQDTLKDLDARLTEREQSAKEGPREREQSSSTHERAEREQSETSLGDSDQRKALIAQLSTIVDGLDGGNKKSAPETEEVRSAKSEEVKENEEQGPSLNSVVTPTQRKAAGLNAMQKLIKELQKIVGRNR